MAVAAAECRALVVASWWRTMARWWHACRCRSTDCSRNNRSISSLKTLALPSRPCGALAAAFNRLSTRSPLPACRCPSEGSRFPLSASSMSGAVRSSRCSSPEHDGDAWISGGQRSARLTVPMRDGVALAADVYSPRGAQTPADPHPTYALQQALRPDRGLSASGLVCAPWLRRGGSGHAGTLRLGGRLSSPTAHEAEDGADTIGWAAALPNSTGRVAPSASRMRA